MTRRNRWILCLAAMVPGLMLVAEVGLRWVVGIGEAPYSIDDPSTEYRFAPGATYHRMGHTIHFNAYSMRSEDFSKNKTQANERRILFIGDSIINGGGQTDQSQLASELIGKRLREEMGVPVVVGNASAASWGPENELGYVRKFGLFDADVVVLVVSSHDATDKMPDLSGIRTESAPYGGSRFALQEAVQRLWPRGSAPAERTTSPEDQAACVEAFETLILLAQRIGAKVIVAQHLEAAEKPGEELPGYAVLRDAAQRHGVTVVDLGPAFAEQRARGQTPYRDSIHPNAIGQKVIADVLYPALLDALKAPAGN